MKKEVNLMKQFIVVFILFWGLTSAKAQEEGLPDKFAQKPNGKTMPVKILREDCNFVYYAVQRSLLRRDDKARVVMIASRLFERVTGYISQ